MPNEAIARLTERQKACLRLVGQGFTSKEIGRALGISYTTVDTHVRAALEILQADNRAEAARILLRADREIPPPQPLSSRPPVLASLAMAAPIGATADVPGHSWLRTIIPPLGGQRNTLDGEAKAYAILRVAVLSLSSLIILILAAAVLLWLSR